MTVGCIIIVLRVPKGRHVCRLHVRVPGVPKGRYICRDGISVAELNNEIRILAFMEAFIKNMVCNRCVMVVREIFEAAGLKPVSVTLGKVVLNEAPSTEQMEIIETNLASVGFEILTDQKKKDNRKNKKHYCKTNSE